MENNFPEGASLHTHHEKLFITQKETRTGHSLKPKTAICLFYPLFIPLHRGPGYLLGLWLGPFYDLGAQNFFLANNGLGAFLEPNWKVFHHGTLRNQFQGVCVAIGSLPISEKMEYPGRKVAQLLHLTEWQQDIIDTCKGYQIDRHEKFCQYMPRNLQKVKFLTDFKGNFSIFYDFLENFWIQKAGKRKVLELR